MIVSIHQPNFMPWYPFFQKIQQADIFVILENCQFEKNNFQNRFNMDGRWYTMSTSRHLKTIKDKVYLNAQEDWLTIKRKLPQYKRILDKFDDCITSNLSETNYKIITKLCNELNIETKLIKDFPTNLRSTERLVDICKKNNASVYISGTSGANYLNLELFENNNIKVKFQKPEEMKKTPILKVLSGEYKL